MRQADRQFADGQRSLGVAAGMRAFKEGKSLEEAVKNQNAIWTQWITEGWKDANLANILLTGEDATAPEADEGAAEIARLLVGKAA